MSLLGTPLSILIGPTVPVPPPVTMVEALDSIRVSVSDTGRTGFQIGFRAGRGLTDLLDYDLVSSPLLRPFSRVVMTVVFGGLPEVLLDGIVTNQQLSPGQDPGTSTLTLTGEDVSVMMDLEEKRVEHPAQPEMAIALKILASYVQYGVIPNVLPPPTIDMPLPTERTPTQQGTDLDYLMEMAERYAYVFYVTPGPVPLTNTAYWGPPVRVGIPQRALSANLGPFSNVESIDFQVNGLAPTFAQGTVQDRRLAEEFPIRTFASTRLPPLVREPAWITQSHTRLRQMDFSGLDAVQALARAQAATDESMDEVVTATGELDALRYEGLLRPRGLVGLRGVGDTFDGFYYVKQVTHTIRRGSYKQSFTLTREGTGALAPVVVP